MKATAMSEQKHFSAAELSKLNTKENVHLLISGKGQLSKPQHFRNYLSESFWLLAVYAVAPFVDEHPGGDEVCCYTE